MPPKNSNAHRITGFTLVEAITAAVIIAVIAIAAMVTYSGYVQNTRQQTVDSLAETAAAAASAYVRKTGSDDELDSAALRLYLPNPADYSVTVDIDDNNGPHGSVTVVDNRHTGIAATKYY